MAHPMLLFRYVWPATGCGCRTGRQPQAIKLYSNISDYNVADQNISSKIRSKAHVFCTRTRSFSAQLQGLVERIQLPVLLHKLDLDQWFCVTCAMTFEKLLVLFLALECLRGFRPICTELQYIPVSQASLPAPIAGDQASHLLFEKKMHILTTK